MKDVMRELNVNGVKYPMAFNINVVEIMQEKYGSIQEWSKSLSPEDGTEPRMKDIIFTYKECINEGIDIENETVTEKRPFITDKQTGRIISALTDSTEAIKELVVESYDNGKEKNVMTEQNQTENQLQ